MQSQQASFVVIPLAVVLVVGLVILAALVGGIVVAMSHRHDDRDR